MRVLLLACLCALPLAAAAEFRSVATAAVLYDGPSVKATKLYVIGRDVPLEVITSDGMWSKVRDAKGELAWIERKALSDKRMLQVTAPMATVRAAPQETAAVAFQAQQGVLLEWVSNASSWIKVKHADGSEGYVRINEIWGL